jgi:hypothetical protein
MTGVGVVKRRYVVVLRTEVVEGKVVVVVFTVTTGSRDDAGIVAFGTNVVVIGLDVVVEVGRVVARRIWEVVNGLTVEVDVV